MSHHRVDQCRTVVLPHSEYNLPTSSVRSLVFLVSLYRGSRVTVKKGNFGSSPAFASNREEMVFDIKS